MTPDSDSEARLRLRVAVKLCLLLGAGGAAAVALGFVFGGPVKSGSPVERVSLAAFAPGETRTVGWNQRAVIILRRAPETIAALRAENAAGNTPEWLVAHAQGTGQGCPVVWEAEPAQFRETCGDSRYDAAGQPLSPGYPPLEQPPHRIEDGVLILGE